MEMGEGRCHRLSPEWQSRRLWGAPASCTPAHTAPGPSASRSQSSFQEDPDTSNNSILPRLSRQQHELNFEDDKSVAGHSSNTWASSVAEN